MADRPILFSAPMIRAILDGRKTQTRRIIKPQPHGRYAPIVSFNHGRMEIAFGPDMRAKDGGPKWWRPIAQSGDRMWAREAHALLPRTAYRGSIGTGTISQREHPTDGYSAAVFREGFDRSGRPPWRPSIHMPRWASRITLYVTEVRVERLNSISEADAIAEGIEPEEGYWRDYLMPATQICTSPVESYRTLWESINGAGSWAENPWVAAYTFAPLPKNIDAAPDRLEEVA